MDRCGGSKDSRVRMNQEERGGVCIYTGRCGSGRELRAKGQEDMENEAMIDDYMENAGGERGRGEKRKGKRDESYATQSIIGRR